MEPLENETGKKYFRPAPSIATPCVGFRSGSISFPELDDLDVTLTANNAPIFLFLKIRQASLGPPRADQPIHHAPEVLFCSVMLIRFSFFFRKLNYSSKPPLAPTSNMRKTHKAILW